MQSCSKHCHTPRGFVTRASGQNEKQDKTSVLVQRDSDNRIDTAGRLNNIAQRSLKPSP